MTIMADSVWMRTSLGVFQPTTDLICLGMFYCKQMKFTPRHILLFANLSATSLPPSCISIL